MPLSFTFIEMTTKTTNLTDVCEMLPVTLGCYVQENQPLDGIIRDA
jgi:hypothetical protein